MRSNFFIISANQENNQLYSINRNPNSFLDLIGNSMSLYSKFQQILLRSVSFKYSTIKNVLYKCTLSHFTKTKFLIKLKNIVLHQLLLQLQFPSFTKRTKIIL